MSTLASIRAIASARAPGLCESASSKNPDVRPRASVTRKKALPPTSETLRISTITAQGSIGDKQHVSFSSLFKHFPLTSCVDDRRHLAYEMIKYNDPVTGFQQRGDHPKQTKKKAGSKSSTETLRNQITVVQWIYDDNISQLHHVSIKVFTNGRVHIAGLRKVELGIVVIRTLIETIEGLGEECGIVSDTAHLFKIDDDFNYSVIMINCDFKVPFMIKCRLLHSIVRGYGVKCHYEQDNKAGIKISYNCICPDQPECPEKVITIMVCRTGSVIMTGATSIHHLPVAYEFVKTLLFKHKDEIAPLHTLELM
jgi:hypothetical protein